MSGSIFASGSGRFHRWGLPGFVLLLLHGLALANGPAPIPPDRLQGLSTHPVWQALLHSTDDRSPIDDPAFLLSLPAFSPERELALTLDGLFPAGGDTPLELLCRFPARYHWLAQQLRIAAPLDPVEICPEVREFFARAPAERISLVYASENLVSASSMMGHVLLKLSGPDAQGKLREHAISYFTEIRGFNVPRILFESLVTGKPGYYTLSPYAEKREFYLEREGRNVWTYTLRLDAEQRQLLRLHLVELRPAKLRYFFDSHNCATLTADLIGLVSPKVRTPQPLWTSPLDVVRNVNEAGLVEEKSIDPSSSWQQRMLEESLSSAEVAAVRRSLRQGEPYEPPADASARSGFLSLRLAETYAEYFEDEGELPPSTRRHIGAEHSRLLAERYPDLQIDLSDYKAPERTPQDSQLRIGWTGDDGRAGLTLGFLPAAWRLEDDHRQQFGETELRLADTSLRLEADSGHVELDEFQLYSMTSLIPFHPFAGGLSGRFRLGVEPHWDRQLHRRLAANVSGGLGLTTAPTRSLWLYGLAGAGVAAAEGSAYGYLEPELGLVFRPAGPVKTRLSARLLHNQLGQSLSVWALGGQQTLLLGRKHALVAGLERRISASADETVWQLSMQRYF